MSLHPYKLFGQSERDWLFGLLQAQVIAWRDRWLPAGAQTKLTCAPAHEWAERFAASRGPWIVIHGAGQESVHIDRAELDLPAFASVMLGTAPAGEPCALAEDVARDALCGLCEAWVSATRRAGEAPEPQMWVPGSAAFAAALEHAAGRLTLLFSAEWTLRRLRERGEARPNGVKPQVRKDAIAAQRIRLHVMAGWAELDIKELHELRPGDVIALERSISEPLTVVVASERESAVCAARLGLINGRRAACLSAMGSHGT